MIINCLSSKLALKKSDTTYSYPEEFSIPISRQLMIAKSAAGDQTIIIMVNYLLQVGSHSVTLQNCVQSFGINPSLTS